ncbi:MAG: 2,3-bisphosphoglycerate-independent phosphoglycerate mutase [Pseudomonadota bacterium]
MIVELEVLLEDKPGTLIKMLSPISENNCNIHGIFHGPKREKDNLIPVFVKFEVPDDVYRQVIEEIGRRLAEINAQVIKFDPIGLTTRDVKAKRKGVLIILDGSADLPMEELEGRTPLEAAHTPTLDQMAAGGVNGAFTALGPSKLVGSDTAIMSILGYDPYKFYTGRGPLEVAGVGLEIQPGDVSFRCNYVTVTDDFKIVNRTAGYPRQGTEILEEELNKIRLSDPKVEFIFRNSKDYRCVLRFRGYNLSAKVSDMDPNYNAIPDALDNLDLLLPGEAKIILAKPTQATPEAKNTAKILNEFVTKAHLVLKGSPFNKKRIVEGLPPANAVLPRGAGETPSFKSFLSEWGINAGCISGTGLVKGMAKLMGMEVPEVPGATGYVDTDYLSKAKSGLELLNNNCDFVVIHIEGIDEVSHDGDVGAKIKALEDSSEILTRYLVDNAPEDLLFCVLSDHTTSCRLGDHTSDYTPVMFWSKKPSFRVDNVRRYSEIDCLSGGLGNLQGADIMPLMMSYMGRTAKYGA